MANVANINAQPFTNAGNVALGTASALQGLRDKRLVHSINEQQEADRQVDRVAQEQAAKFEAQRKQQAMMEGGQLLQSGDTQAVADWAFRNPNEAKQFTDAAAMQDNLTTKPRLAVAKDVLSGRVGVREGYQSRIDEIEAKGGNADQLKEALANQSDEQLKNMAVMDLAMLDQKAHESYMKTISDKEKGFTLSEGEGRYDNQGSLIAYMPKTIDTLDRELKTGKDLFDKAAKLRGEVEKVTKVYRDVQNSFGRIKAASSGEPNGATDMALIFNYMKMLDPGSTVREGEFATAANTGGMKAKVINMYNKAKNGEMITPEQRINFVNQAQAQMDEATSLNMGRMNDYEKLGKRYGLGRGDIIISEESAPQAAIDFLRSNPNAAQDFKAKYGYLPEGL